MSQERHTMNETNGMNATQTDHEYGASEIQVLEGLEAVRKRPGMYIGSTSSSGLHHLVYEIVDNAIDEALAGYCDHITVEILEGDVIRVTDNGRGVPVDIQAQTGRPALEVVYTVLHAGGKFGGGGYKVSGGLHGVGGSVVNALSEWMEVRVHKNGQIYEVKFSRGNMTQEMTVIGTTDNEQRQMEDPAAAVHIARTEILAGERDGGLSESIYHEVAVHLEVDGGSRSRGPIGAECVDSRENEHIRECEHRALQAGRKTDTGDLAELTEVGTSENGAEVEVYIALLTHKYHRDNTGIHHIRYHSAPCDTGDTHAESCHQQKVKAHIHTSGHHKAIERTPGISNTPQHSGAKIVYHHKWHAERVHTQIQHRLVENLVGSAEKLEYGARHQQPDGQEENSTGNPELGSSSDRGTHTGAVPLSDTFGYHHIHAHGKPDEHIHDQTYHRPVAAHGGQGMATGEPAHHSHVDRVERLL